MNSTQSQLVKTPSAKAGQTAPGTVAGAGLDAREEVRGAHGLAQLLGHDGGRVWQGVPLRHKNMRVRNFYVAWDTTGRPVTDPLEPSMFFVPKEFNYFCRPAKRLQKVFVRLNVCHRAIKHCV